MPDFSIPDVAALADRFCLVAPRLDALGLRSEEDARLAASSVVSWVRHAREFGVGADITMPLSAWHQFLCTRDPAHAATTEQGIRLGTRLNLFDPTGPGAPWYSVRVALPSVAFLSLLTPPQALSDGSPS